MEFLKSLLNRPQSLGGAVFLTSFFAICAAFFFQYVMGLMPCTLCYLERDPFYVLIPVGVALYFATPSSRLARCLELFVFLLLFAELGLNLLHWGVEARWWESPFPSCHMLSSLAGEVESAINSLPMSPVKPCDTPDYIFNIPLSLSHLSALYSLFVFCAILVIWFRTRLSVSTNRPVA